MFILMFALQCLFPVFDLGAGEFVGLSVLNSDNQVRQFTVTGISADGNNVATGQLSLAAGTQRALLLNELFGAPMAPAAAWLRVDSTLAGCTSYLAGGDSDSLLGLEGAVGTGTTVYLPQVSVATGFMELNHTDTSLAIVNPGQAAAVVTGQLYGLNGVLRGSINIAVPVRGSRSLRASEAFAAFMPDNGLGGKVFEGYIRLLSSVPIAAWERIDTPLSRSAFRGRAIEELPSTTLATIPHFAFGGTYGAFINLINPTASTLNLELSASGAQGQNIGETIQVSLAPGEGRRSSVGEFFRVVLPAIFPPPLITGQIRVRSQNGAPFQILGNAEIFSVGYSSRDSSMLSPITDAAATSWTIPFAASSGEYFTGYAVSTPNELLAVQTDIQVDVLRSDGTLANRSTISLSPRGRQSALVPTGLNGGYVRFTSSLPFHVIGSIGSRDGRYLDQLPAIR